MIVVHRRFNLWSNSRCETGLALCCGGVNYPVYGSSFGAKRLLFVDRSLVQTVVCWRPNVLCIVYLLRDSLLSNFIASLDVQIGGEYGKNRFQGVGGG